ncbi:MAG: CDP-diacylglycerol--serine O-phosphatidyltransferase, partial [Oscillospiraceae bacterium]
MIGFYNYSVIATYLGLCVSVVGIAYTINGNFTVGLICLLV